MKVSIITPAYNQADFIEETIKSILEQDYPDIEYIVLDDGSSDSTSEIVSLYSDRLKYLHHENMGESKTVNKGYRLFCGDIVGIVNADDPLFTHDAVTRIVECFKSHPNALAVYPDWVSIDKDGNTLARYALPKYTIGNMLKDFNVALGPGMFIKRSTLESVGYRNDTLKYTGDLDLSFRIASKGTLEHVPAFLATHRVHPSAASSSSQGSLMAAEVFRLAKSGLDLADSDTLSIKEKYKILSNAYYVASTYCGSNNLLRLKYIFKSILLNPVSITNSLKKLKDNLTKMFSKTGVSQRRFLKTKKPR